MRFSRMFQLQSILQFIIVILLSFGGGYVFATENGTGVPIPPIYTNEELLTKMLVVDASEQLLDDIPALSVTFSQQLDSTAQLDSFFTVTENGQALQGGWIMADNPRRLYFTNIKPNITYRVQIRPGLESVTGLKLQKPGDFSIKTRDIKPAFDFATRGSILPTQLTDGLPVRVVNVPELDIEFLRVRPERLKAVLKNLYLDSEIKSWKLNDIHELTESVYSGRYTTEARRNARETLVLPVESVAALQEPGLYFAVMRQPGRFTDNAYRITHFIVTNIGLHVRMYKKKLHIFTRALDSGKALPGVKLKLQGSDEVLQAESDAQGQGEFAFRPRGSSLLTAELEGQFAFLDLRQAALDLSEYPVTGQADKVMAPFIFAPRDLYRPGETLNLSVLLRNRDGLPEPVSSLNLRLVRPDTKLLLETAVSAKDTRLGYFSYAFNIPAAAPTGLWRAEIRLSSTDKTPLQSFSFNVEEFLPERMKLSLNTGQKLLQRNERQVISVQGDYLYGAPAAGNKLKAARIMSLNRHPVDSLMDYYFGNPADEKELQRKELSEITLDDKGSTFLDIDPVDDRIHSALKLDVIASLSEPGGRVVTRTISEPYWPAEYLIGIKPMFEYASAMQDSEAEFSIVRVDAHGKMQPGEGLAATLVKEEYEYFWEHNDQDGWVRRETRNEYPLAQQKFATLADNGVTLKFPVAQGRYRLEVEDASTGLKAVYPFSAGWSGNQVISDRPDKVALQLDKAAYKAGDTVQLKISSGTSSEAVITVEGDSLLWSEVVPLSVQGTTVGIPVSKDWERHDLYISVAAFRPSNAGDRLTPGRSLGIIHLPLDRTERKMDLSIIAPEQVLPEQKVRLVINAGNLNGEKALLSLAAVDVGVLNITGFKTPDPWRFFFDPQRYGVDIYDDYGRIIESVNGKAMRQRFGGGNTGSAAGGTHAKADVQVVSLFRDLVSFDEQGNAEVELYIPGFDGRLRLMAVAMGEKLLGSTEKEMLVASPVVASISGPRFLASGDSSFVTVELNNVSGSEQTVQVRVSANQYVDFVGVDQAYTLQAGQRELLKLPIAANTKLGVGQIRLQLSGQNFTANRKLELAVRPPYPGVRKHYAEELRAGAETTVSAQHLDGILPETLEAQLSISNIPALPVTNALQNLLRYPYGCLEQTASGAYPYLFLEADDTDKWGLSPLTIEQRNEHIQSALLRLTGMQLNTGLFTLWGNYGAPEYWLTPYVADFLVDAQQQGFLVPKHLLEKTLSRLEAGLQEGFRQPVSRFNFSDYPEHMNFAARAYTAYVLARLNRARLGTLRAMLKDEASKAVTGLPLVHLGLALVLQGDKPKGEEAIRRGLQLGRNKDDYLGDYGSRVRDQAMMLYQLLLNGQTVADLGEQVAALSSLTHGRSHFSTQEQIFIFLLGRELEKRSEEDWKAQLTIGDQSIDLVQTGSYTRALDTSDFTQLKLKSKHDEPLYVSLDIQGYPDKAPLERNKPVSIRRDLFKLDGTRVPEDSVRIGDLLLTRLTVRSEKMLNDALVVDLLPSGFDIENTNLLNNKTLQGVKLEGMGRPLLDVIAETQRKTEEFRDDRYIAALKLNADATHQLFYLVRVIAGGNITVPPPYVEDMYRPDIHAVGASAGRLPLR